jgi:Asp-tRNA(Asn)/Glu-tRNA(Gln) amidotransferase A subunit family amidase
LVAPQDTIGPLARSVADAARLLSVMADEGTRARSAGVEFKSDDADGMRGMRQTRIGVLRNAFGEGHPEMESVNDVVMRALETVAAAGAMLVDLRIPSLRSDLETTSMYVLRSRHDLDAFFASRPELPVRSLREIYARRQYDPRLDLIDAIVGGPELSAADPEYGRRQAAREAFTALLEGMMDEYTLDVIAYPTVQVLAPIRGDEPFAWTTLTFPTNTVIASQAWMPAMSLPVGFASGGPVGLELLARQHDEARLLRVAASFEQLTRQRRPPAIVPAHE